MSRDGMLPPLFSRLHPRMNSPVFSILVVGAVASLLSSLLPINLIAELANIGTLSAFAMVSIGVIVLRHTHPDQPRPFKVPLVPYLPLLSVAASVYLMTNLPVLTWYRFLAWLVLGLIIYFTYGIKHSRLAVSDVRDRRSEAGAGHRLIPQPAYKYEPKPPHK